MDKTGASTGIFSRNAGGGNGQHGTSSRVDYSIIPNERFLLWEKASRDTIELKRIYVDITDDLITGLLLSQIIYWHLPSKEQRSKLTIERDGKHWLAKSRNEWWDECRISPKQYDRAITILEKTSLVDTATYKFKGNPTKHISLNWEKFLYLFEQKLTEQAIGAGEIIPIPQEMCPPIQDSSVFDQRGKTILPKGEKGISLKGKNDVNERSRTNLSLSSQEVLQPQDSSVFDQRAKRNFPKGEEGISPKGNLDLAERARSYIRNTETTAEITADNIKNASKEFERPFKNGNQIPFFEEISEETFPLVFDDDLGKMSAGNGNNKTTVDAPIETNPESYLFPRKDSGASKSDQSDILALRERYGPEQLEVIDQAIDAFASTRKTYTISTSIVLNQLRLWSKFSAGQVMEGLTIYLEKDYAVQGKTEDYALGIIRNVTKQKQYANDNKKGRGHAPKLSRKFTDTKYAHLYIRPGDPLPTDV